MGTYGSKWEERRIIPAFDSNKQQLTTAFPDLLISLVDERYSSLEARDRYWQMYPPNWLIRFIPHGMRQPPRPIDDIVAIILIERYLARQSRGNLQITP